MPLTSSCKHLLTNPSSSQRNHQCPSVSLLPAVLLLRPSAPTDKSQRTDFHIFQYFLSVVSTTYVNAARRVLRTNQYSVTEMSRTTEHGKGVPGIFFKFDVEPMSLTVRERTTGLVQFLVRLAGIVGGILGAPHSSSSPLARQVADAHSSRPGSVLRLWVPHRRLLRRAALGHVGAQDALARQHGHVWRALGCAQDAGARRRVCEWVWQGLRLVQTEGFDVKEGLSAFVRASRDACASDRSFGLAPASSTRLIASPPSRSPLETSQTDMAARKRATSIGQDALNELDKASQPVGTTATAHNSQGARRGGAAAKGGSQAQPWTQATGPLAWLVKSKCTLPIIAATVAAWAALEHSSTSPSTSPLKGGSDNPLTPLLWISYALPPIPGDASSTRYGKGPKDLLFLGFYIIVFSFVRQALTEYLLRPLARALGLKTEGKITRFMEQAYAVVYFSWSGAFGLVRPARFPPSLPPLAAARAPKLTL